MKNCFNCNNQVDDNATFCPNCGANLATGTAPQTAQPDPYDHTAELDANLQKVNEKLNETEEYREVLQEAEYSGGMRR